MKKLFVLIILGLSLSGCATYKFQKSTASGSGGYLASYDGKPIPEYTAGEGKSLPDLTLAKERFNRRRPTVEYYYKQMDLLESRLKETFWDPPAMLLEFVGGIFRWPFVAVADYRYNHNPQYKARVDRLDQEKEVLEKLRQDNLKAKLGAYILADLAKESPILKKSNEPLPVAEQVVSPASAVTSVPKANPIVVEPAKKIVPAVIVPAIEKVKPVVAPTKVIKPVVIEPVVVKTAVELPVAVITVKPARGYSPLTVKFSGQKSSSKSGKIVAYDWNFGDGDTSTQTNPENTYWSTTFGPRDFTVTLLVKDSTGNTSVASTVIEVITK